MAELGWIEGKTFFFECVSTFDRLHQLQPLAHELVSRRPDVVVVSAILFVKAVQQETTTIPIVMASMPEPVRLGIVTNLARPEGNVTGVAWFGFDILPKQIELLKEIVPHLRKLAIIQSVNVEPTTKEILEETLTIGARTLGYAFQYFQAVVASDYDEISARIAREGFDAAYVALDPLTVQSHTRIIELALRIECRPLAKHRSKQNWVCFSPTAKISTGSWCAPQSTSTKCCVAPSQANFPSSRQPGLNW